MGGPLSERAAGKLGSSAATQRESSDTDGEDDDTAARLAAIAGDLERLLANPPGLCESAEALLVNASEQLASVRVALEDNAAVLSAVADGYAAGYASGLTEGLRRAAEVQHAPRQHKSSGPRDRQLPIMKLIDGGLAAAGDGAALPAPLPTGETARA